MTQADAGHASPWSWVPPAQTRVECSGATHWVRWEAGQLVPLDHDDVVGERTLAALGRQPIGCLELLDLWNRHSDDLRVLLIASRGPGDPLGPNSTIAAVSAPGQMPRPRPAIAAGVLAGATAAMVSRLRSGSLTPSVRTPRSAQPVPHPRGAHEDPVARLITMSGPLVDRLVATVASNWEERGPAGDPAAQTAKPAITAALYGRAALAVRTWLGTPDVDVNLTMAEDGQLPSAQRDADGTVSLLLPFSWITAVWARGLTTILGRFTLRVLDTDGDRVVLEAIGPDFGPPATVTVTLDTSA